jgi:hypothetical protein
MFVDSSGDSGREVSLFSNDGGHIAIVVTLSVAWGWARFPHIMEYRGSTGLFNLLRRETPLVDPAGSKRFNCKHNAESVCPEAVTIRAVIPSIRSRAEPEIGWCKPDKRQHISTALAVSNPASCWIKHRNAADGF